MRNLKFPGKNGGFKIDEKNENVEIFMIKFNDSFFLDSHLKNFLRKNDIIEIFMNYKN